MFSVLVCLFTIWTQCWAAFWYQKLSFCLPNMPNMLCAGLPVDITYTQFWYVSVGLCTWSTYSVLVCNDLRVDILYSVLFCVCGLIVSKDHLSINSVFIFIFMYLTVFSILAFFMFSSSTLFHSFLANIQPFSFLFFFSCGHATL